MTVSSSCSLPDVSAFSMLVYRVSAAPSDMEDHKIPKSSRPYRRSSLNTRELTAAPIDSLTERTIDFYSSILSHNLGRSSGHHR